MNNVISYPSFSSRLCTTWIILCNSPQNEKYRAAHIHFSVPPHCRPDVSFTNRSLPTGLFVIATLKGLRLEIISSITFKAIPVRVVWDQSFVYVLFFCNTYWVCISYQQSSVKKAGFNSIIKTICGVLFYLFTGFAVDDVSLHPMLL